MINYMRMLKELKEEKAACQYAYGGMVPAFYSQALQKAIQAIEECQDCAAETARMADGINHK